jgi:uncharacterized protein YeaO (DUF488 family)
MGVKKTGGGTIQVKRVYEKPEIEDGARFLVDRLWPRGLKKTEARLDGWLRDAAPSDRLRRWFGHDAARWKEFQARYREELRANPAAWKPIVDAARRGRVTLLFAARDNGHNNAVSLKSFLARRIGRSPRRSKSPPKTA